MKNIFTTYITLKYLGDDTCTPRTRAVLHIYVPSSTIYDNNYPPDAMMKMILYTSNAESDADTMFKLNVDTTSPAAMMKTYNATVSDADKAAFTATSSSVFMMKTRDSMIALFDTVDEASDYYYYCDNAVSIALPSFVIDTESSTVTVANNKSPSEVKSTAPYTSYSMQRDINPSLLKNNGNDPPVAVITKISTLYASPSYDIDSSSSPIYNEDTSAAVTLKMISYKLDTDTMFKLNTNTLYTDNVDEISVTAVLMTIALYALPSYDIDTESSDMSIANEATFHLLFILKLILDLHSVHYFIFHKTIHLIVLTLISVLSLADVYSSMIYILHQGSVLSYKMGSIP